MTSEYLRNQAEARLLDEVEPSMELGMRMLESARRQLKDASIAQASNETRFDCAYNAIRSLADLGLLMHGYRTPTNRPGHHTTAIQNLKHTLGVDDPTIRVLDRLRKQRNSANYDGEPVTNTELAECVSQAQALMAVAEQRLRSEGWLA